jgi:hypothetical protein
VKCAEYLLKNNKYQTVLLRKTGLGASKMEDDRSFKGGESEEVE